MVVKVGEVSGPHRQVTDVAIEVAGASSVGSMHIELTYDPAVLQPVDVKAGSLAEGALLERNLSAPGRVVIGLITTRGISGSGEVAVVSFNAPGEAGTTSDLRLENVTASDAASQPPATVPTSVQNGSFRVGGGSGGDTAMIITVTFLVMLAAALLIIWQVTKRRRISPGTGGLSGVPRLIVTRGQASPSTLVLNRPVITIGRDPASDLVIMDDLASRQHAQIRQEADGIVIYDLGSTNGTVVSGRRIADRCPMRQGDVITVGGVEMTLRG
jgi:pSer/pThr/pTyr-binding forkhead associated (FHA) protein